MMSDTSWMNDPNLEQIDPAKLQMLLSISEQTAGKSKQELLPFLMAAATKSKAKGMSFSPEETDSIIQVLKTGKSKEEIARIDKLCMMMKML
jgi:hypothetical protein